MRYGWLLSLLLFSQSVTALTCSESSYLQGLIQKQQYQQAIQVLDQCLSASGKQAQADSQLLIELRDTLLEQYDVPKTQIYQNFQTLFNIHPLKNLTIKWKTDLESSYPFTEVKLDTETYYFYYDTGRFQTQARGIVLTDKAIIWKNMLSTTERVAFTDIKQLELAHGYGLSLTAWKLRINQTHDIRLSQLTNDALQPFISALFYFIQSHTTQDILLDISSSLENRDAWW